MLKTIFKNTEVETQLQWMFYFISVGKHNEIIGNYNH